MSRRSRSFIRSEFRNALKRLDPELTKGIRSAVADSIHAMHAEILAATPVRTGRLKSKIRATVSKDSLQGRIFIRKTKGLIRRDRRKKPVRVRLSAEERKLRDEAKAKEKVKRKVPPHTYAYFIEFGTLQKPAQPFFFPAFERNKKAITDKVAEEINRALGRIGRG